MEVVIILFIVLGFLSVLIIMGVMQSRWQSQANSDKQAILTATFWISMVSVLFGIGFLLLFIHLCFTWYIKEKYPKLANDDDAQNG